MLTTIAKHLGVHFPSDVVGAICLGAGWARLVDAVSVAFTARETTS